MDQLENTKEKSLRKASLLWNALDMNNFYFLFLFIF